MSYHTERRVVITGLGVVAPNAIGKEAFWHATSRGISGIKTVQPFATADLLIQASGHVDDFTANQHVDHKLAKRTDRMSHFALVATQEALQDANLVLEHEDLQRVGAVVANSLGGIEYILKQIQALHTRGPRSISAFSAIAWLQVASAGQIATHYGIQGYCKAPVNDSAGSLNALGIAYEALQRGAADIIITGGTEAFLHPLIFSEQPDQIETWATGTDPQAYRPFDKRAAGLIPAEGAGICILEEYTHAQRRGASIYGEIIGFGQTNDAHGLKAPSSDGRQYARAISLAMQEGQLHSEDISYFSLDGRALTTSDRGEAEALHLAFGPELAHLPVSVPRTMLGHSYAAAGALDTITSLLALRHSLIPPTINCEKLDLSYGLNLVGDKARSSSLTGVLIGGRSIGGTNIALAIKN